MGCRLMIFLFHFNPDVLAAKTDSRQSGGSASLERVKDKITLISEELDEEFWKGLGESRWMVLVGAFCWQMEDIGWEHHAAANPI